MHTNYVDLSGYLSVDRVVLRFRGEAALALVVVDAQDETFPLEPLHARHQPTKGRTIIKKLLLERKCIFFNNWYEI